MSATTIDLGPASTSEQIDNAAHRIAVAVASPIAEYRATRRDREAILNVELGPVLGHITLRQLADMAQPGSEGRKEVRFKCSQGCGADLVGMQAFSQLTACDECRAKAIKADLTERCKLHWSKICPAAFLETDKAHKDFPKAQYAATKQWVGESSLFFFGESRRGKTRLAMLLLKRCLLRGKHVGVLWSPELKAITKGRFQSEAMAKWASYDVLVMDDAILAAASSPGGSDFLKDLIDTRMNQNRHQIITSQIGSADLMAQTEKFKGTKADKALVEALCGRVREICTVVSFEEAKPAEGESAF